MRCFISSIYAKIPQCIGRTSFKFDGIQTKRQLKECRMPLTIDTHGSHSCRFGNNVETTCNSCNSCNAFDSHKFSYWIVLWLLLISKYWNAVNSLTNKWARASYTEYRMCLIYVIYMIICINIKLQWEMAWRWWKREREKRDELHTHWNLNLFLLFHCSKFIQLMYSIHDGYFTVDIEIHFHYLPSRS